MLSGLGCGVISLLFLKRNLENHENIIYSNFALIGLSVATKKLCILEIHALLLLW